MALITSDYGIIRSPCAPNGPDHLGFVAAAQTLMFSATWPPVRHGLQLHCTPALPMDNPYG